MIRERKGHQSRTDQPTLDDRENCAIFEWTVWWSRGEHHGRVLVGAEDCLQPTSRMENRGARVALHEFLPTRVRDRVELIDQVTNLLPPGVPHGQCGCAGF